MFSRLREDYIKRFLRTGPEMLLHDKHMVRSSMSDFKWVKTRDKFGVSYASEACLKK